MLRTKDTFYVYLSCRSSSLSSKGSYSLGKENAFGDVDFFFIENEEGRGSRRLRALPEHFEFRLGPGKRWQQHKGRGPCSCCVRPRSSRFGIY
ncbi:hypothetical protein LUZ63_023911 [Rhynchospora breviuscula]|uniref:Uncharacterized protein n=1 Tax=Rhynchospora breviuscula TaxID=2022672 RepID=A0A9Q0BX40_9POAL|nr:hypothetical protein LUZ63_023911 [Rhynchospora breviuscula]